MTVDSTPGQGIDSPQAVAYVDLTLIDGTGAAPLDDAAVVVNGPRIDWVGSAADLPSYAGNVARVARLEGAYVLPGLIDTHQHVATPPDRPLAQAWLRRQVYGGVTAIRDMADDLRHVADLARARLIGEILAPDIHYAALMAGPHFFSDERTWQVSRGFEPGNLPWMQAVTEQTDLAHVAALAKGTSASAIKVYADLDASLVQAIVNAAHQIDMKVWAHAAVFPATPAEVVAAGVDTISHAQMIAYQLIDGPLVWYAEKPNTEAALTRISDPTLTELWADMKRRGTILDATVSMWRSAELSARPNLERDRSHALAFTRAALAAGVEVSAGTDYETPFEDEFPSVHREILSLVHEVGMMPSAAIRAATLVGARALGMADEMGSIEVGKLANLVVLRSDPLEDIANIRSVELVVKRGRELPRAEFHLLGRDSDAGGQPEGVRVPRGRGASRTTPIINALGGLTNPNTRQAMAAAASVHPEAQGPTVDARTLRDVHRSGLTAVNLTLGHVGGHGDDDPYVVTIADIERHDALIEQFPDDLCKVLTAQDLSAAHQQHRVGLIYGFQNSVMFGNDTSRVETLAQAGVRVAQLTYNPENAVGAGCMAPPEHGLTKFGRELVRSLNTHTLMVDLSHSNQQTCLDAIEASAVPISINHTGCRALADLPRNKTDEELRLVAESSGFVGIYFMPFLRLDGHPTAVDVANHICHAVDVCGIDHVGIGSDGDVTGIDDLTAYTISLEKHVAARRGAGISAVGERADTYPFVADLRGPGQFDVLADLLRVRGFTDTHLAKIFGLNFIAYAQRVWPAP